MLLLTTTIPQAVISLGEKEGIPLSDFYLLKDGNYWLRTGLIFGKVVSSYGEVLGRSSYDEVGITL